MSSNELNERAQQLLKTLVECYIRDGQPVGSRTLARSSDLDLSPASIRNVMADLEELGLVTSPHTSAGRVPTAQGYRVFVDSLLRVQLLESEEVQQLQRQLALGETPISELVGRASRLLSGVTRMAGLVTVPRRERALLRHVEFVALSDNRVLAIFVINDSEVQNHVIHTERDFTPSELTQAANYLNRHCIGKELNAVRADVVGAMREAKDLATSLLQAAMEVAERAQQGADQRDYVLAGQTNLMDFSEFSNVGELRQLFDAFAEKRDILHLLDQCLGSNGVQIFIGDESGYQVLGNCSVVTAPYGVDGKTLGVLGVIGPTRMAYERVIPIVDVTAKLLGAALNSRH